MEYSNGTRTLTPTPSNASLQNQNIVMDGGRKLSPSPSSDSLLKAAAIRKMNQMNPQLRGSPVHAQGTLGQSLSVASLLSVDSDSSAPPPVAPPRSAQLHTGEVLRPNQFVQVQMQASASNSQLMAHGVAQVNSLRQSPSQPGGLQGQRNPSTSSLNRGSPHHVPNHMMAQSMAVVHPQSVIAREAPQAPVQQEPPPQQQQASDSGTQSTWVIEEVIDFGPPVEGLVRECDDIGYPMDCKINSRGSINLFDGCFHNVCVDEELVMAMQSER